MTIIQQIFCLGLIFFCLHPGYSQSPGLVRFSDLSYHSDMEKIAFLELQEEKPDYLKIFLAVSPVSDNVLYTNVSLRIDQEISGLRQKKFEKLKDEAKVNKIYNLVNDDILKRYREETLFPDIFNNGNFNCLTASALYGFLFSELGIEYEFRETANHVHPVAFPGTLQIKVETTDPYFGFQYFDTKLKIQFVNYLVSAKIISREDAAGVSVDSIFNRYYFPESNIGLRELAGLQYLNDALYSFSLNNFAFAFRQIQKAYYLYPSDRVSTVMMFLLSNCIAITDYRSVEDAALLLFASRFIGRELPLDFFMNEFALLTDKVLLQRSQAGLYDMICEYLISSMDPGEALMAVKTEYYFQKGRVLLTSYRVKEALSYFEKALVLNPDNIEIQSFTVQCLAFTFSSASNQEILNTIEEFELEFPVMQSNEGFIRLHMLSCLQLGEEKFDFGSPAEGDILLKKFENLFHLNPGISIPYEKVGDAYSAAAVYYFKRNDLIRSKAYLTQGLKISPENYQLMYRLRSLDDGN